MDYGRKGNWLMQGVLVSLSSWLVVSKFFAGTFHLPKFGEDEPAFC